MIGIAGERAAAVDTLRHARCLAALRRVAWDPERDLIRARRPDATRHFVPEALSRVNELAFLDRAQARAVSQLQACTYAHSALRVERCVAAVMLRASELHWCGDTVVLQAHLRVADDALKHQGLFRSLAAMTELGLRSSHAFTSPEDGLSRTVLRRGRWASLALALALVLAAQAHYRHSLEAADALCPLWQDVFLFHWKEASQHAVLIELAWREAHARADAAERGCGIAELAAIIDELAGGVQRQAEADADHVMRCIAPDLDARDAGALRCVLLQAYRHQFIGSGLAEPRFMHALRALAGPIERTPLFAPIVQWTQENAS